MRSLRRARLASCCEASYSSSGVHLNTLFTVVVDETFDLVLCLAQGCQSVQDGLQWLQNFDDLTKTACRSPSLRYGTTLFPRCVLTDVLSIS